MHEISIDLCDNILEENEKIARRNRERLKDHGISSYDLFGPVGSGKTMLIEAMAGILGERGKRVGVIAGDVAGDEDYQRFRKRDLPVVNLNTGKECHLDAHLAEHALDELALTELDVLFVENVGNIICPADFPLGTDMRIIVISVTEGDDMVKKHPMVFQNVDAAVINKADLAGVMEVECERILGDIEMVNPGLPAFLTDAKHGDGVRELMAVLGF